MGDSSAQIGNSLGEPGGDRRICGQQVESQPLGGPATDARKLRQPPDQAVDGLWIR